MSFKFSVWANKVVNLLPSSKLSRHTHSFVTQSHNFLQGEDTLRIFQKLSFKHMSKLNPYNFRLPLSVKQTKTPHNFSSLKHQS